MGAGEWAAEARVQARVRRRGRVGRGRWVVRNMRVVGMWRRGARCRIGGGGAGMQVNELACLM